MATVYEFVVETLTAPDRGDDPDILDTSGFDTLAQATAYAEQCEEPWRICLRRDTGSDAVGITDRFYAYPFDDGKLPERMESADGMDDGPDIPVRFRHLTFPLDTRHQP